MGWPFPSRRGWLLGMCLVALAGGAGAGYVYFESERIFSQKLAMPKPWVAPLLDPSFDLYERGRHITTVIAQCQFCHGNDLGGKEIADDPLIGRIDSSNLTAGRGGVARDFSDADWERSIRYGLKRDGHSLLLMPSRHLASISDRDLMSVIAFLRGVPAVDRIARPLRIGLVTRVAVVAGAAEDIFSADPEIHARMARSAPEPEPTEEYGDYLVAIGNCRVCHHANLEGGLHPLALPGEPPPPTLRGPRAMEGWALHDFARAMTRGVTPDGRVLDREYMPWPSFAGLSELEIEALWRYLKGSPAASTSRSEYASRR